MLKAINSDNSHMFSSRRNAQVTFIEKLQFEVIKF